MGTAGGHYLSHLEQEKYVRKHYALVGEISKKTLQLSDGRSENLHICLRAL